jgi:hypothetical protein
MQKIATIRNKFWYAFCATFSDVDQIFTAMTSFGSPLFLIPPKLDEFTVTSYNATFLPSPFCTHSHSFLCLATLAPFSILPGRF